jgi:HEAT repeat protein
MGAAGAAFAPQVAARLADISADVRGSAAEALADMGAVGAAYAPQVAEHLADSDNYVRVSAAEALARMGAAGAAFAPRIVTLLQGSQHFDGKRLAEALGHMGAAAAPAVPQLGALLQSPDPKDRAAAVNALGLMGSGATFAPQIAALLQDNDLWVREAATKSLGKMGPAAVKLAPRIVELLRAPLTDTRKVAGDALGEMGPSAGAAVPEIAALLKNSDEDVRSAAVEALGKMGPVAASAAPQAAALLQDSNAAVRSAAVVALGKMGPRAAVPVPQVGALLQDSNANVRFAAVETLGEMGPAGAAFAPQIAALLEHSDPAVGSAEAPSSIPGVDDPIGDRRSRRDHAIHALDRIASFGALRDRSLLFYYLSAAQTLRPEAPKFLLRAYLYNRNDRADLGLIRWLGNRDAADRPSVTSLDHESALAVLRTFRGAWDATKEFPGLRQEMAERIADLTRSQEWSLGDVLVLQGLYARLAPAFPVQAFAVQAALDKNTWYKRLRDSAFLIAAHGVAWLALIFAYPRIAWVQSFFFWNKWARRFLGAGYVGMLITVVPWLRRRMFLPFRGSLLPQALREQLSESTYFADSEVLPEKNGRTEPKRLPLRQTLASIRGQVLLKGQSGLGKTLLLLHLALSTKEPVVFLRATECAGGVLAAIQKKLHGQLRDAGYLRALIHAGALKVLIDGMNEASPDARARITQFVEEYFKGDFILTTQPISGPPPATARVYVLQPLLPQQIEPFLLQQWEGVQSRATLDREHYEAAVRRYVEAMRQSSQSDPRLVALSNPMDATLAAELLARGETPDVFRLVEQRYRVMSEEFRAREGRDFQLERFAERVYDWRNSGESDIHIQDFEAEVASLVKDRLMLKRTELITKDKGQEEISRWFFRHDKIMEFFLLPAFMEDRARREEHYLDEQFWGVYELLAVRLPPAEGKRLHQFLIERAADTNRNELLNRYTLARHLRAQVQHDTPTEQADASIAG